MSKPNKFIWEGDDIVITPSVNTERYILAAAAADGIEKASYEVTFFQEKGYLDSKFALTHLGEARLLELLRMTKQQNDERLALAKKWETGNMTEEERRQLAHLSGLALMEAE